MDVAVKISKVRAVKEGPKLPRKPRAVHFGPKLPRVRKEGPKLPRKPRAPAAAKPSKPSWRAYSTEMLKQKKTLKEISVMWRAL